MNVVFMFDTTGLAAEPFTKRGATIFIIDTLNVGERASNTYASYVLDWEIKPGEPWQVGQLAPDLIFGFPLYLEKENEQT